MPMLLWMTPEYLARRQLDVTCVTRSGADTSHDAVFPLVIGLLDLHTTATRRAARPDRGLRAPTLACTSTRCAAMLAARKVERPWTSSSSKHSRSTP